MGGFLLFVSDHRNSAEEIEKKYPGATEVFRKKGLALSKRMAGDDFVILVYDKYCWKSECLCEFDDGSFIIATGTCLYDGKAGRHALRSLYEDFSNGRDFQSHLFGHFCLLILDQGRLFVFTDYAGIYKVYCNRIKSVLSSSFLAVAETVERKNVSRQELYEYLYHEAFYGGQTLFPDIEFLDSRSLWQISPVIAESPQNIAIPHIPSTASFEETVDAVGRELEDYFRSLRSAFDHQVASSLSSGYDTRLMLALIRKAGISPYYFVYGAGDSVDVQIAQEIAKGEDFDLDHIDKGRYPKVSREVFYETVEKNYFLFDGLGAMGVFDDGSDIATRIDRARRAQLHLNAGGGELYRRTWGFPDDKKISIEGFLKNAYGYLYMLNDFIDYRTGGERFDKRTYLSNFKEKIKSLLDIDRDWLNRRELETLYAILSVQYWLGMNDSIDNQFSYSLTPFAESRFILQSLEISSEYKSHGRFEAALIRHIASRLARYRSQYGFNFYDGISRLGRLKESIKEAGKCSFLARPIMPFIQNALIAKKRATPYYLQQDYLEVIFKHRDLHIRQYVDIDRVKDPAMLSRALTLELVIEDIF